jgi:hypothetical protein
LNMGSLERTLSLLPPWLPKALNDYGGPQQP